MLLCGVVSHAQAQGPRESQEDYVVHVPFAGPCGRGHLLGIMDGHGGKSAARLCAEAIPRLFNPAQENIEAELRRLVERLDARTMLQEPGSTLSLACVNESKEIVTLASLGDSPIIVFDRSGNIHVSEEHNVRTNEAERNAALQRGAVHEDGYIYAPAPDGSGLPSGDGLQLSRALGDQSQRQILNRTPAISQHRLGWRSLVLLASDGLLDSQYDKCAADAAPRLVIQAKFLGDAPEILRWRERREFRDNTSVLIWRPKRWRELLSWP